MHTPWKSTAAGIFDITAGLFALIGGAVVVIVGLIATGAIGFAGAQGEITPWETGMPIALMALIFGTAGFVCFALGGVALWGGIHAVRKQSFGWSLAASICTMLVLFPVGLVAVVLTLVAEPEFPSRRAALADYNRHLDATKGPGPTGGGSARSADLPEADATSDADGTGTPAALSSALPAPQTA